MITIHTQYERPQALIDEFCNKQDEKFKQRYSAIFTDMTNYIKASGYEGKVLVNELSLGYALIDYFEDIRRLKTFHHVPHINSIKLVAYMAYWLLRRKPLQVVALEKEILYVNERFVLAYVLEFLNDGQSHILERENEGLRAFAESLLYFFKYRQFNAQTIEMIVLSFFAGQIYQSKDVDISAELPMSEHAKSLEADAPTWQNQNPRLSWMRE